jgi:hypothetical protein
MQVMWLLRILWPYTLFTPEVTTLRPVFKMASPSHWCLQCSVNYSVNDHSQWTPNKRRQIIWEICFKSKYFI